MSNKITTTQTLRATLLSQMDGLINGSVTSAQARSVAALSNQIVATARLELDVRTMGISNPPDTLLLS